MGLLLALGMNFGFGARAYGLGLGFRVSGKGYRHYGSRVQVCPRAFTLSRDPDPVLPGLQKKSRDVWVNNRESGKAINKWTYIYIYIYIYVCAPICLESGAVVFY